MKIRVDIDRNTDTDVLFQFKDEDGKSVDLTGYSLKMQVRPKPQSPKLFDELSTENGRLVIEPEHVCAKITAESSMGYDAETCHFDILATSPEGRKTRICEGTIVTSAEVTL